MIKLILCAIAMSVCVDFKEEKYLFESFDSCGKKAVELVVRFNDVYAYCCCCGQEKCNRYEREENVEQRERKERLLRQLKGSFSDRKSSI